MKKFWLQSLVITTFVFFMMWGVSKMTDFKLFNAFDPISQALSDFELTDYAFSNLRPDPVIDQRIVLVNIGTLSRRGLAQELQIISQFNPKVIGIDALFNCGGRQRDSVNCPQLLDTLGNLMLSAAIMQAGNVVLGEKLLQTDSLGKIDTDVYDSIAYSDPMFKDFSKGGFVSLPTNATYQEDVKLCRSIFPKISVAGEDQLAFSVQLAMQYDSVKAKKFIERNNYEELVNFRGNIEVRQLKLNSLKNDETATTNFKTMFYVVDVDQVMRGEVLPEMFKDNIVMMGFLGKYLGDPSWEDKFFTPLNKKVAGRANPDMFGLIVHANAVAMILNEDYVNELQEWQEYLIAFIVCFLTVALFMVIDEKLPIWFDAFSVLIQVFQLLAVSGLMVYAFALYSFKLDLTLTLAAAALVGPGYDIFKSAQKQLETWLTNRRKGVLKS